MDIKKIIAKKESKKRLYDFSKKVIKKLMKEDESFLGGTDCSLDYDEILEDTVEVHYSYTDDGGFPSDSVFYIPFSFLDSEDVDACVIHILTEIREERMKDMAQW